MATLDDLFKEYLRRIEPSEQAVTRAKESHGPLREDLEKDEAYGSYVTRTILSGSYGRDTAILYIKDVDVIIQTTLTRANLREKKRKDETEQECLLRLTQEAINRTGRVARTRKARRSIHVTLPEEVNVLGETVPELTMDIVPVLIQTDKDRDPMTVADKDLRNWYETYPITQLSDSVTRNARSAKIVDRHSYKPLVKIFKAWKQVHFRSTKAPKGFVLECLTAKYHNPNAKHWVDAVRDLFQNICNQWPNPESLRSISEVEVPDISTSSPSRTPIAKTIEEAQRILKKIHRHLDLVKQAIEEAESDLTKSAKTLQRVLGQDSESICFPLPEELDNGDDDNGKSKSQSSPARKSRSDVRHAPPFG